jgi:hypothetical protein
MGMQVGTCFHLDQHDRADLVQREIAHTETHYVVGHQTTLDATLLTCVICHDCQSTRALGAPERYGGGVEGGAGLKYI